MNISQVFLFTLAGLLGGSFVNVVIHRGPFLFGLESRPAHAPEGVFGLDRPRSHCPACGRTLAPHELIPVLSFLLLKGRCGSCRAPIAPRYPAVELLGALGGAGSVFLYGAGPAAGAALAVFLLLLAAAAIDAEIGYLPDALLLPALWIALLAAAIGLTLPASAAILGAAAGYLPLRLLGDLYERLRGREGLGRGDAKLCAVGGAWLGPFAIPFILLAAAVFALAALGALALSGRKIERTTALPFGPYLVLGIVLCAGLASALPGRVVPAWPFG